MSCEAKKDNPATPPIPEPPTSTISEYTVTFNTDGGNPIASVKVKQGDKVTKPNDPTRNDYFFEGWYKEKNLTTLFDFTKETITADTIIYAKWKVVVEMTFPYIGANELTFSITNKLEGAADFTFGISASKTTTRPDQLGKGYITRTLTKDVSRDFFMAHLNTIPNDINMITAEHFMQENTTYYLNVYQGKKLVSQKSFTTAKFMTLTILERRQGANNIGIHSWNQYFPSNGSVIANKGGAVSTPKTSTEKDSPRKIEVKKEEYLILPIRVVIPIFAEPSPITASEEAEIYLFQINAKAFENNKYETETIFFYFRGVNPPLIGDGSAMNSKTIVFKTNQAKSTNFDAYLTFMITIPTSDPATENNFINGELELELNSQLNAAKYIGSQNIQNIKLITK